MFVVLKNIFGVKFSNNQSGYILLLYIKYYKEYALFFERSF